MNWDDLRVFLAVLRHGSASQAARQLGLNHTTVARRIRLLEEALGTLLFERSRSHGFTLTRDGQQLVPHAEAVEQALQAASERVSGSGSALAGHVRIGLDRHLVEASGELGPLAAITARHLPACRHQLLAQIEAEPAATSRHQCTHNLSFCQCLPTRGPAYQSPRHKPLAPSAVQGT